MQCRRLRFEEIPFNHAFAAKLWGLSSLAIAAIAVVDAMRGRSEGFEAYVVGVVMFSAIAWNYNCRTKTTIREGGERAGHDPESARHD